MWWHRQLAPTHSSIAVNLSTKGISVEGYKPSATLDPWKVYTVGVGALLGVEVDGPIVLAMNTDAGQGR